MNRRLASMLILALTIGLLTAACVQPGLPTPTVPSGQANMANPASVYCEQQGGRLEIRTDASGAQAGYCHLPDGSECEEWAYFRGDCGPATPEAAATATAPATVVTGAITYTSPALGISFSYLPEQNGEAIKVFGQGDKIYVYPAKMEPMAGQWVQVFEKPAGESLVDAITRVIMLGHPAEDCRVVKVDDPMGGSKNARHYEYAGIVVRREAGEDEATVLPRWKTCPQPYTVVGGIGYFQADPQHPEKFLFFSIGQYGIMAGGGLPWQETVRFE